MKDINKELREQKSDKRWLNTGDQLSPTSLTVSVKYLRLLGVLDTECCCCLVNRTVYICLFCDGLVISDQWVVELLIGYCLLFFFFGFTLLFEPTGVE